MKEEEWKAFETWAEKAEVHKNSPLWRQADDSLFLAAYKELKERREDEEWLKENDAVVAINCGPERHPRDRRVLWPASNGEYSQTIHAAVLAARGGK